MRFFTVIADDYWDVPHYVIPGSIPAWPIWTADKTHAAKYATRAEAKRVWKHVANIARIVPMED